MLKQTNNKQKNNIINSFDIKKMLSLKQKTIPDIYKTNDDSEIHYVYLLANGEHIGKSIYKIGKTTQRNLSRLSQYPKDSVLYVQMICFNCHELELKIIELFSKYFRRCYDLGNEYFEGKIDKMLELFVACVMDDNQYYNFELKKENTKDKEMDIDDGELVMEQYSKESILLNDEKKKITVDDCLAIKIQSIGGLCNLFNLDEKKIPTHEAARRRYLNEFATNHKIIYKITLPNGDEKYVTKDEYLRSCTKRMHETTGKEIGSLEYQSLSLLERSNYLEYPKYTTKKIKVRYSKSFIN